MRRINHLLAAVGATSLLLAAGCTGSGSNGATPGSSPSSDLPSSADSTFDSSPGSQDTSQNCQALACLPSKGYELDVLYVEPFGAQFNAAPSQPAPEIVLVVNLINNGGTADYPADSTKAGEHLLLPDPSPAFNPRSFVLVDAQGETQNDYSNGCTVSNGDGNTHPLMENNGFIYNRDLAPGETEGPVDICFAVTPGTESSPSLLIWTPNADPAATVKTKLPAPSVPPNLPAPLAPQAEYPGGAYGGPSPNGTPEGQTFVGTDSNPVSGQGATITSSLSSN
jgi:hypothetical protein